MTALAHTAEQLAPRIQGTVHLPGERAYDKAQIAWARATAASLEPSSLTGGGYVNYLPPDGTPERALAANGAECFRRLAE